MGGRERVGERDGERRRGDWCVVGDVVVECDDGGCIFRW